LNFIHASELSPMVYPRIMLSSCLMLLALPMTTIVSPMTNFVSALGLNIIGNDNQIHLLPDPGIHQAYIGEFCSLTDTDFLELKFG